MTTTTETWKEREKREKKERQEAADKAAASAVDWRGTPITTGCRILYPITQGRSTQMVQGTVVGFLGSASYTRFKEAPYRLRVQPDFECGDEFQLRLGRKVTWDRRTQWVWDKATQKGEYKSVEPRQVTLERIDTVTVVPW